MSPALGAALPAKGRVQTVGSGVPALQMDLGAVFSYWDPIVVVWLWQC